MLLIRVFINNLFNFDSHIFNIRNLFCLFSFEKFEYRFLMKDQLELSCLIALCSCHLHVSSWYFIAFIDLKLLIKLDCNISKENSLNCFFTSVHELNTHYTTGSFFTNKTSWFTFIRKSGKNCPSSLIYHQIINRCIMNRSFSLLRRYLFDSWLNSLNRLMLFRYLFLSLRVLF